MSFNPYRDNGGTVIGIPGKDFVVVGGDTRLSLGYSIQTRYSTKLCKLTDKCIICSSGMQADMKALHKILQARLVMYEHKMNKPMSTPAIAQMLSNTLYFKRFFPYYTFNLLAGLDEEGRGVIYGYDAIGSYEAIEAGAQGSGQAIVQPLLDNQISFRNQKFIPDKDITIEEAVNMIKDAFNSATERDIYTGDYAEIAIITKDGVKFEKIELKLD